QPDLDIHVFMMDMRAFSKGYWGYFERARTRYGIHYHHCRTSSLHQDPENQDLLLRYMDEGGTMQEERFNLAVLSVGMEISKSVRELGSRLGVELDEYGFCHTVDFNPLETSRKGIFAIGPFREPKDIPESVVEASGAAAAAASILSPVRFSLTTTPEYPPENDISQEEPRIGVFVCSCGSNIGGFLNVPAVTEYASTLPNVVHSEYNLYTCSQDSIHHISEQVKSLGLNRVVVASCTPLTHQPLFQDSIRMAGLNAYLFEMANIRNQCSWVHSNDWEVATLKAKQLVKMAVSRAALLSPQHTVDVPVNPSALVVGGGVAGMTAALSLTEQGFPVHLVEKEHELGGNLRNILTDLDGKDLQQTLDQLKEQVCANQDITLHLESQVTDTKGFMGNFNTTISHTDGTRSDISHGATILATGAQEYRGPEYGYGTHPNIITQMELETHLESQPSLITETKSVVMIQCVGPAEKYCSRICCSVALKNALRIKDLNPNAQVTIIHHDIRTYGFKERLYTEARRRGVIFVRYNFENKPQVEIDPSNGKQEDSSFSKDSEGIPAITLRVLEPALNNWLNFQPDLLVLSMPVIPRPDNSKIAGMFKVSQDSDGFFLEAHVKLRPVDFASDGIFMAGMSHYPKLIDETMIQAQAAAARAVRVLSRETLTAGGRVAVVDQTLCTGCLTCVRICPFNVPQIQADLSGIGKIMGAAYIEAAVCQGCGLCVAECPGRAIQLMHYTDIQMDAKVSALLQIADEL
ncbi:MAG: FAD-dependent oxidoreductase, partial [Anaerolineales bacterium]